MTSTNEPEVLKVDRRGRVHASAARREALLDEFDRSGVSAPEFARMAGINYATFAGWRARRKKERETSLEAGPSGVRTPMRLFEATIEAPGVGAGVGGLAVELPGGERLLITGASQIPWAAELLRVLRQPGLRPC
jgi:hypothetical protein